MHYLESGIIWSARAKPSEGAVPAEVYSA
jgi:hypothetical protein